MSGISNADAKVTAAAAAAPATVSDHKAMTAFVESCVETVSGSAQSAARQARGRPRFRRLLRLLQGKRNILVTTHRYPDPDALASGWSLCLLLGAQLPNVSITMSVKDNIVG
ncbi:MAG: hypothetical protein ABSB33_01450, partial [Tepidisphaeraceae bacterium]